MVPTPACPDYKNVGYDEDGHVNIDGELIPRTHSYENQVITGNGKGGAEGAAGGDDNEGIYDPNLDYMNQDPEGRFHTYTNQDDLLQQVRVRVTQGMVCTVELFYF